MTQNNTPQQPVAFDTEKKVAQYVALRDALRVMDEEHEKRRKDYVTLMEQISGQLLQFIETNNAQNLKTKSGTCYVSSRVTASLADPDAFMKFVIANGKFELLDRRANATTVKQFVEDNNTLPPGCNLNTTRTLGVRRPTKSDGK